MTDNEADGTGYPKFWRINNQDHVGLFIVIFIAKLKT